MSWYKISNEAQIDSPAILVYPDRIQANIVRMIKIAGGTDRLRPHVKTYKIAEIVNAQMAHGIQKFKCATISEAEMLAGCNVPDVLFAYQPVGPKIHRLLALVQKFPRTQFSTLIDNLDIMREIANVFNVAGHTLPLYIDLDVGLQRTGIASKKTALNLIRSIEATSGVQFAGLHIYDGHLGNVDFETRLELTDSAWENVNVLIGKIDAAGIPVSKIIAGGTPSFPVHARRSDVELSPGTVLLWDRGYEMKCPELPFESAAMLLTRVVSRPTDKSICLDLGTKAIASEMKAPRAFFPELPVSKVVMHNEEHLVLQFEENCDLSVGQCLYAIPWHICPTVALYAEVGVVAKGQVNDTWRVVARDRKLTV
jgi:D-serine deaminase-like pyridoxal phosphate-dependent protein